MQCVSGLHTMYDVLSILQVSLAEKNSYMFLFTLYIIQASV